MTGILEKFDTWRWGWLILSMESREPKTLSTFPQHSNFLSTKSVSASTEKKVSTWSTYLFLVELQSALQLGLQNYRLKNIVTFCSSGYFDEPWLENFTLPHRFHVESRSIPRVHVDFRQFFFGGSPANFLSRIHVESMRSPAGLQLLHLARQGIWIHPARLHMDSTWIYCIQLSYVIYYIK